MMNFRRISRIGVMAALLLMMVSIATAQNARPLPVPASGGGIFHTSVPFELPAEYLSQTRGTGYTVTTTADRDNTLCTIGDLSLREALQNCGGYLTVYVPAGTYTLEPPIVPSFSGLTLIGEDPFTTIIQSAELDIPRVGSDRLLDITASDDPLLISNLTFQNGNADQGGAIRYVGYGTFSLYNVAFFNNQAEFGGAIYIDDGADVINFSAQYVSFESNTSEQDGGAIYISADGNPGHSVAIEFANFTANTAATVGCTDGGGAIAVLYGDDYGGSFSIANAALFSNATITDDCDGGAIMFYHNQGTALVSVDNVIFVDNYANGSDSYGGAIYTYNEYGTLRVTGSAFDNNIAAYGGAIYDDDSYDFTVDNSLFIRNNATQGGAIYAYSGYSFTSLNSQFLSNSAVSEGGALWLSNEPALLSNTDITSNRAGDLNDLNGYGGGLFMDDYGAQLLNTQLEDNMAEFGPQCYENNDDFLMSLGGNGITDTTDCEFVPVASDVFDNMLLNGGFELGTGKTPDSWTVKNASGDKRACYFGGGDYGLCEYAFKGGLDANTVLQQNVVLGDWVFTDGMELGLYGMGEGVGASNVQLQAKATYTDTQLGKTKVKVKFIGANPFYEANQGTMILIDSDLSKLQVKITDKSTGGKFYLDRVYLNEPLSVAPPRSADSAALPLPLAPEGFRGGN
jgi:predicted outer membrane repeat protein